MSSLEQPEPTRRRTAPSALLAMYERDEVELLCQDPRRCFVYWEVTESGLAEARSHLRLAAGSGGLLLLRIFSATVRPGGRELREVRDVALDRHAGSRYLDAPPPGSVVRAAVGLFSAEGLFAPIAHSSPLQVPPEQPARETSVEWLNVEPARGDGRQRERIVARPDPTHHERAVPMRGPGRQQDLDPDRSRSEGLPLGNGSGGLGG